MESGRISSNRSTPMSGADSAFKNDSVRSAGQTTQGQKVVQASGADVTAHIPREHAVYAGVKLSARTVTANLPQTGFFNRLICFLRNRPNSSQRSALWNVYRNLEKSLGADKDNPVKSETKSSYNGLTANWGSDGHKALALLVNAGLARFSDLDAANGSVSIQFVRPDHFQHQVRATEALVQVCPICIGKHGHLDWKTMTTLEGKTTPPGLSTLKCLQGDKPVVKDWYMAPNATREVEALIRRREVMEQSMDDFQGISQSETQWDFARRRMKELVDTADKAGVGGVRRILNEDFRKRLSLHPAEKWQQTVERITAIHPRMGEFLAEATPDFSDNITASPSQPVQFHTPPSTSDMRSFLEEQALIQVRVTSDDIANTLHRLEQQERSLPYPLEKAYRESVQRKKGYEMNNHFGVLRLSKQHPVSVHRLQQGLGALRRMSPAIYEQCVNDGQRADLLQKVQERKQALLDGAKELSDMNQEYDLDAELLLRELLTQSVVKRSEEDKGAGDYAATTIKDRELSPDRVIKIITAYDALAGLLKEAGRDMTYDELLDHVTRRSYQEGEPLSATDWQKGIERVPLPQPDRNQDG